MKYITKSTSGVELRQKCKEMQEEIWFLHSRVRHFKGRVKEVIEFWNKKYNKLKWKMYKKDQHLYMKDVHIKRLRVHILKRKHQWIKEGFKKSTQRYNNGSVRVRKMSGFMFHMATVMDIYDLSMREYAFLTWAGKYDFFNREDFVLSHPSTDAKFYIMAKNFMKRGLVILVQDSTMNNKKVFALSGTGIDLYRRISKFTNKFLIDSGT